MTDQVSPEAVEAALGLNTVTARAAKRYFSPNRYATFVRSLLQAALPALREQLEAEVRERLAALDRYEPEIERGCGWDDRHPCELSVDKMDDWERERHPEDGYVKVADLLAAFPPPPEEQSGPSGETGR